MMSMMDAVDDVGDDDDDDSWLLKLFKVQRVQILNAELKNELSQSAHPHVINNPNKKQITIRTFMASLSHFPLLPANHLYLDF